MSASLKDDTTFPQIFPNISLEKKKAGSALCTALLLIQKEIQNPKNTAYNPYFESNYVPLAELLKLLKPLLNEKGILLIQDTGGENGKVFVQTSFIHPESGEIITLNKLWMKPQKLNPQGGGSAITYARRYQLTTFFGIMGEDDDDGNRASSPPKSQPKSVSKPAPKSVGNTKKQTPKSTSKTVPKSVGNTSMPPAEKVANPTGADYWKMEAKTNEDLAKVIKHLEKEKLDINKINILEGSADLLGNVFTSEQRGNLLKFLEKKEDQ